MRIDVTAAIATAAGLEVLDQATGSPVALTLNDEQHEILEALCAYQRVIVLKARQQGISTLCCLYDLLHAVCFPGQSVAIVADTADKAQGLLAKVAAWARTMGLSGPTMNVTRLTLSNGSTIDALSAVAHAEGGESRTGRSKSYGLIHASELAFWYNDGATMAALLSTALPGAKVIVESTASPAENLFRSMWDDAANGWHHIFLSVERHAAYVADPDSIDDARYAELRSAYGFTSRPHAAWWHAKLRTDLGGDVHRALREYPIRAEQAFSFAEGRWIHRYRAVEPHRTEGHWRVYIDAPEHPVVFGVDTGAGVGGDYSAIAVICQRTGDLIATWTDNKTPVPAFIATIEAARARWRPVKTVVESNGIGAGVFQALQRPDVAEHESNKAEKAIRFDRLREAIETGVIGAGPELVAEIKSSVVDRAGKFTGRDDLLNAVSFALEWRRRNPWQAPVVPPDLTRVYSIAERDKRRRRGKSGA